MNIYDKKTLFNIANRRTEYLADIRLNNYSDFVDVIQVGSGIDYMFRYNQSPPNIYYSLDNVDPSQVNVYKYVPYWTTIIVTGFGL